MPTRLVHVIGEQTTEDARGQLSVLLARLPGDQFSQRIEAIGRVCPPFRPARSVGRIRPSGLRLPFGIQSPELDRSLGSRPADLVVAWDVPLAPTARNDGLGWLWVVSTPRYVADAAFLCRHVSSSARMRHVVCSSRTSRQHLLGAGLSPESVSVIRPVADFDAIRRADRRRIRAEMGLAADARVILTIGRPSCRGGQYTAVWATAILYQIWPDVRMILPGGFREDPRARRLAEKCYCPEIFRVAGEEYGPAELLAASDMLVFPAVEDQETGWLAWAMAAGVPIVATPTPSVTELITDGRTGFLADSARPHALATRIRTAWDDADTRRRCAREAGCAAYELFRSQKCLDDYLSLFERLLER